ncbi:MAG TPA: isoprenylcysteine carboxylmethyltransferase family protein [Steroidobacteraceae bacterium]|jgi:protein-S-isoprenylcysteine O-methyltransferase Ste14|nr:isoprenylcysteine carboxylmethyltransferase family protein [Steroidobacteraceae bacterium]
MRKLLAALYSVLVYGFFLGVFLYAIGFVENLMVPKSIDSGTGGSLAGSLLIDAGLLGLFAVQHSVMARPGFKRLWTRIVPRDIERSTFVLFASVALALLCWQWRPLPQSVWLIEDPIAAKALLVVSWCGWGLVLLSTFLISHFHLFGVSQGFARLLGRQLPEPEFVAPFLYKWLRHPIYAGFILAFWAAPRMSLGHLFFAVATTGYIFVGIWLEERDLIAYFGDRYRQYRATVGMLVPKVRLAATRKGTVH